MANPVNKGEKNSLFPISQNLLVEAKKAFSERNNLYWITGGAASGKTTLSTFISKLNQFDYYDVDSRIYGGFSYDPARHPVNVARNNAQNPLDWALCLSLDEFNSFGRATTVEYLDLMARDIPSSQTAPMIIDGGITHPRQVAQAFDPSRIICLHISDAERERAWLSPERSEMKVWIDNLPEPEQKWQRFLEFDRLIADVLLEESLACGIKIIERKQQTVEEIAEQITRYFGL